MLHPTQFEVNEAWIAFQLNRVPLQTERDGPLNCLALMDAASCYILGSEVIAADRAEPNLQESRRLLEMGRSHKRQLPKTLVIADEQTADVLAREARRHNIEVVRVPESELMLLIGEARDCFDERFGSGNGDA
ncbi:MAG: hypothetical protein WD944_11735 [Steroidobacteraceae bacterium]